MANGNKPVYQFETKFLAHIVEHDWIALQVERDTISLLVHSERLDTRWMDALRVPYLKLL
jgi:hypothetical protein